MKAAVIVLAVLCCLLAFLMISLTVSYIVLRAQKKIQFQKQIQKQGINEKKYEERLLKTCKLTPEEAKKEFLSYYQSKFRSDLAQSYKRIRDEFESGAKNEKNQILINAMQHNPTELVGDYAVSNIPITDEEIKPRLIGRDGRNKHVFEFLTGVDLIVEKNCNFISVSSLNQIRRQIAKNLLLKLIEIKYLDPLKIENTYKEVVEEFDKETRAIGKDVVENILKVYNLDPSIYYYVGRLKYRTSYSQNNLDHSIECAYMAADIAKSLGVDQYQAKMCAFFHDIGKSIDFEIDQDHVMAGLEIADKCHLPSYVRHAIHCHHGAVPPENIYAAITKIVDAISASRPGARNESSREYFERVNRLEAICREFPDVEDAYVLQSGRHVVAVIKNVVKNRDELEYLMYEIQKRIESDDAIKNYKITIEIIQEVRLQTKTSVQLN